MPKRLSLILLICALPFLMGPADFIPDRLTDLTGDVTISSPADTEVLTYESATSKWKNKTATGASTSAHYLTDRAEAGLTAEINLALLSTGLLKGTVAAGVSTISAITDNSTNWDTAYTDRLKWDGGATGLTAATGRTSLELGSLATLSSIDISANTNLAVSSPITLTGDSVGMVNQGTITTVLHGNAAGNPSFGAVVSADITDATITYADIQNISASSRVLGRITVGAGITEELTGANIKTIIGDIALTTDTSGNYVASVADGTGIDGTASAEGATYTPTLDLTEINSATFGNGTFTTLTFDAGVSDPVLTFGSGTLGITGTLTATNLSGTNTGDQTISDATITFTDITTGNFGITKHGFVPKGTNVGSYLKDDGTWGTPSGSGAPSDATYITQTSNASLSAEQALSSLATGIMYVTNTTGVITSLGTTLGIANGGTGLATSTTAYGVVCAGTTATGAYQVLNALGSSGQVLTSNGAAALPTWQTASGGANTALSNLSSVAINTTLLSDTDATDDLGSASIGGNDSNTKLLMHFDGADASTTFTDSSASNRTATVTADAQIDTAQSKFGGASGLFDGTTDRVTYPNSADFEFGSGNFSIDGWIRPSVVSGVKVVISRDESTTYVPFIVAYVNSSTLAFYSSSDGATWDIANAQTIGTVAQDTWYHFEVSRSGNNWYTFLDGVQGATWTSSATVVANSGAICIGLGLGANSYSWAGWIDELRVVKGIAGHTANFTLPSFAYGQGKRWSNVYASTSVVTPVIKPHDNSITAVQIQNATGTNIVNIDTVNSRVGIGTTAPTTGLEILAADNATAQTVKINAAQASVTTADTFIDFRSTTGSEGGIAGTASAGVIAYNTWTSSHYTIVDDADRNNLEPNILLEAVDNKILDFPAQHKTRIEKYNDEENILDANGNPIIIKVKNPFSGKDENKPKTKTVKKSREIILETYKASAKGQLFRTRICKTKGSIAAIGTWGGRDKEGRDLCLSGGVGYVFVKNTGQDIKLGDLFWSSDMAGAVELQPDDLIHNYTVAKATEGISWMQGEKKRLISCILLGG